MSTMKDENFKEDILKQWEHLPSEDRTVILHLSDAHIVGPEENRKVVLRHYPSLVWGQEHLLSAVEDILSFPVQPDLILLGGDMTATGSAEEFELAFRPLEPFNVPVLAALGNHEHGNQTEPTEDLPVILQTLKKHGCLDSQVDGCYAYRYVYGKCQFLILDTTLRQPLSPGQHEFLRKSLANGMPTVILMHRPIVSTVQIVEKTRLNDAVFEEILADSDNIIAVLCGHCHYQKAICHNNRLHFISPSLSFGNSCKLGYRLLCLSKGRVEWAFTRFLEGAACLQYLGPVVQQSDEIVWEVKQGCLMNENHYSDDSNHRSILPRVLFVCTGNAGRSQIAEALLRATTAGRYHICSAGVKPWDHLHPMAVKLLNNQGYDISSHFPKSAESVATKEFDFVVTIGDAARRLLPDSLKNIGRWIHWDISDPADADGTEHSERVFRGAYEAIETRMSEIRDLL